jgi:glycopeptide antibiotics resistance protein
MASTCANPPRHAHAPQRCGSHRVERCEAAANMPPNPAPGAASAFLGSAWGLAPLVALLVPTLWTARRHRVGAPTVLLWVITISYAALIATLAFLPLPLPPYDSGNIGLFDERGFPYPWISPIPFETIRGAWGRGLEWASGRYLLGNVLAFVPLGLLVPTLRPRWGRWARVLAVGLATSMGIELGQLTVSLLLGIPYRVADIDDVLLNTGGVLLGYCAYLLFRKAVAHQRAVAGQPADPPLAKRGQSIQ